jgi:transposase
MRTPQIITDKTKKQISELLNQTKTKADFQRVECLWLRASLDLSPEQIALALGLQKHTVQQNQSTFFKKGENALIGKGKGGSYHRNLSSEEEIRLLAPFIEQAKDGGVLIATDIKRAYEEQVGYEVPKSTVYRMLARHGWRKIKPRPQHPKADIEAQEAFKKTSRDHC